MKDKLGRYLPQNQPRPRWAPPYDDPPEVAGFRIIEYLGFHPPRVKTKCQHQYRVKCITCGDVFDRYQSSLTRGQLKDTKGCRACAKSRHKEAIAFNRENEEAQMECLLEWWLMALFVMPVTSLRMREPFDSEHTKVMGWHTV